MKIAVKQGRIHVNFIHLIYKSEQVVILQADLRAKYAQLGATSETEIYLEAGEHTLHAEGVEDPTVVSVDVFPRQYVDTVISRYTMTIFVYTMRAPEDLEAEMVWEDK